MRTFLWGLCIFLLTLSELHAQDIQYPKNVGDINYNSQFDSSDFIICDSNHIKQYSNFGKGMQIYGEKTKLLDYFSDNFQTSETIEETGYITVRFIVNCQGQSGRFRMYEMDNDFKAKKFAEQISRQILRLTRNFKLWKAAEKEGVYYDYYQYLTFKIENGLIKEILP
ncbi:MAG: hypothetical protein Q7J34_12335 [Bacteroidales bacterium]|jgi:hypothetical protein|nr:hypothetical protein [Bacteroidales bacterium]